MTKELDAFHLKVIAIIAMFINHVGHTFEYQWSGPGWNFFYLAIGLLTFPIMAYLLVEGFYYTHSRWKYIGRLAVFWVLSIVPFEQVFHPAFSVQYFNNILFTLMMGLILLMICEKVKEPVLQGILVFIFIILTLMSDWNVFGIPIIFAFYKNHGKPGRVKWVILTVCLSMMLLSVPTQWSLESFVNFLYPLGILLVIPILGHYNGKRGYSPSWVKWGFYAFYPLHLTLLWLLRIFLFGA